MNKNNLFLLVLLIMVFCLGTNVLASSMEVGNVAGQTPAGDSWASKKTLPFTIELGSVTFSNKESSINWTEYSDCTGRAVALGNKIYVINSIGKVAEYDPIFDTWLEKDTISELKDSKGFFKLVVVNEKIYIVGSNFSEILEYTPTTGQIVLKTKLLSRRIVGGAAAIDGKIYVLGGIDMDKVKVLDTVEEYDLSTNKWTTKRNMPTSINRVNVTALNGKLYTILFGEHAAMYMEEFDPSTNSWTQKSQLKDAWSSPGLVAVNERIYLIGEGMNFKEGSKTTKVEEYDPITDKWSTKSSSFPVVRRGISTAVLDGKIYVVGGYQNDFLANSFKYFTNVDEYTPPAYNK